MSSGPSSIVSGDSNSSITDVRFDCTVCEENNIKTEALYYCAQCRKCFCGSCVKLHERVFRDHALLGKLEVKQWGDIEKGVTKMTCVEHHGQKLELYCKGHKVACCTECAVLHHK